MSTINKKLTFFAIVAIISFLRILISTKNSVLKYRYRRNQAGNPNTKWQMAKNTRFADKLASEIRVLCFILITDSTLEQAKSLNKTWGRRCNKILFIGDVTTKNNESVRSLDYPKGRNYLWPKVRDTFQYIYDELLEEAEWFLKADHNTYVIMENLRYLLSMQDPTKPHYLGCVIDQILLSEGYNSGGPGYILNRLAVDKLVSEAYKDDMCIKGLDGSENEDIALGYCLSTVGILPEQTADSKNKSRFFPLEPFDIITSSGPAHAAWYWTMTRQAVQPSLNCCSEAVISFHYVSDNLFWTMEFLLYHTTLFGVTHLLTLKNSASSDSPSVNKVGD